MTFLIAVVFFVISFFLLNLSVYGDQEHYHRFYNKLNGASLVDVIKLQVSTVSGAEPVYGYLMWTGANLQIPKNLYLSFYNAILAASLFLLLKKYRVSPLVIILIFTNFYFFVLLVSAERLKISYMFLVISAISTGAMRRPFLLLGALSHFQTFINYSSIVCGSLKLPPAPSIRMSLHKLKSLALAFCIGICIAGVILLNFTSIFEKFMYYVLAKMEITSLLNLLLLLVIGLVVTRQKRGYSFAMLPIILAAIVLGPSRVNMIGFVMIFYHLMKEGLTSHPLIYALLVYFTVKTFPFIVNIVVHGNGFYVN